MFRENERLSRGASGYKVSRFFIRNFNYDDDLTLYCLINGTAPSSCCNRRAECAKR